MNEVEKLAKAINDSGMHLTTIVAKSGISRSLIYKILNNEIATTRFDTIKRICNTINVNIKDVLDYDQMDLMDSIDDFQNLRNEGKEIKISIGEKLKELRKEQNITQEALGKHFGIAGNTIGQYENNLREPDIATLIKLANFFNVSVDYLVGNNQTEVTNYAEENKEVEDLRDEQKANLYLIKQLNTTNNLIANGYLLRLLQEQEQKNKQ